MSWHLYLSLGDSILSDCFPGPGAGAASLLWQNRDADFPEFQGRDLRTRYPSLRCEMLTRTGHRLAEVRESLLGRRAAGPALIVLSVGGNDMMHDQEQLGPAWFERFGADYRALQRQLAEQFPGSLRLACNVYDPTDGSGLVQSARERGQPPRPQLIAALGFLNQAIAANLEGARLVDVHRHFFGHGREWCMRDIEPNRKGASEIRRLLWECL